MRQNEHLHISPIRLHVLVTRCQAGDEAAFFDLYEIYKQPTLHYLEGLLDEQTAEDVHQEVWLTVYQKIRSVANPKAFRTWLYRTTRFRAIDYLRKQKREHELLETSADAIPDEEQHDEIIQDYSALRSSLNQLSTAHKDVLILLYWEHMSYEEIALIIGCSVGTVRSRIFNAKQKLKHKLEHQT